MSLLANMYDNKLCQICKDERLAVLVTKQRAANVLHIVSYRAVSLIVALHFYLICHTLVTRFYTPSTHLLHVFTYPRHTGYTDITHSLHTFYTSVTM